MGEISKYISAQCSDRPSADKDPAKDVSRYRGRLINHIEALYRPGDRGLAVELAEALGCVVTDSGFLGDVGESWLRIHPEPDDLNFNNNAIYISEITPEHAEVEARMRSHIEADEALRASLGAYREKAHARPFGIPHFGIRYASVAEVEAAADRLNAATSPELAKRVHVRLFRPEHSDAATADMVQGFVYQDVIVAGSFLFGQLIELQVQEQY